MEAYPARDGQLQLSVISGGWVGGDTSLQAELAAVRAALLYADIVELFSLNLASMEGASSMEERRMLLAAAEVGEGAPGGLPVGFRSAWLHGHAEVMFGAMSESQGLRDQGALLQWEAACAGGALGETLERSELLRAIDAGVLRLGADWRRGAPWLPFAEASILAEAAEEAFNGTALPLLDRSAWLFFTMYRQGRALMEERDPAQLPVAAVRAANEAALARHLVGHLEAFPSASVDVVLDVREQLSPTLTTFRAAVLSAAAELTCAPSDAHAAREVAAVYQRTVQPALQQLEEGLEELGARATLRRGAGPGVATLGVLAGAAATVPQLAAAAALPLSQGIRDEIVARRELKQRQRTNPFFFLLQAERLLSARATGLPSESRRRAGQRSEPMSGLSDQCG